MKHFVLCFYRAAIRTIDQDGVEHAGYMAFMILFSIFPFIIFLLVITNFLGIHQLVNHIINFFIKELPANLITKRLEEITHLPPQRLMNLAIIGMIWTSSSFLESLRTILNRVYLLTTPPPYLLRRFFSIIQFFLITAFLSFLMFLLVLFPLFLSKIPALEHVLYTINDHNLPWAYIRYFLIFVSLFISVSFLYYVIPNVKIKFFHVIPGALVVIVCWWVSAIFLSKYVSYYNQLNIVYGSLGNIIITLLFFYIISIIFIYGAEFNYLIRYKF